MDGDASAEPCSRVGSGQGHSIRSARLGARGLAWRGWTACNGQRELMIRLPSLPFPRLGARGQGNESTDRPASAPEMQQSLLGVQRVQCCCVTAVYSLPLAGTARDLGRMHLTPRLERLHGQRWAILLIGIGHMKTPDVRRSGRVL